MSPPATALLIILGIVGAGSFIGFIAGARHKVDLEQWTVGGRGFGLVLVWLLMAGEVYTTFTFLGASGWAYSRGGPALYILAYPPLAYLISFYILPPIWEVARAHGLQTQPDFFKHCFGSDSLAGLVAFIGVVSIIPYLQLQLVGMGIIVQVASYGRIPHAAAMAIAAVLVASFVFVSGVRAVAWVSVLKDFLLLFAAVAIGVIVPYHWFGGIKPMFSTLLHANPSHFTMPGATQHLGHTWYISTVLLTALGFYSWPQSFGSSLTAKSGDTLRRNAIVMPLYSLAVPFVFFAGFAALRISPGLTNGDLSLLTVVQKTFSPWFLGVVGGAGALTAMVPSAILTLTAATLFAKNLYRPFLGNRMNDEQVTRLARRMAIVMMGLALVLALRSSSTLVTLLLIGYAGASQSFPGIVFALFWRGATHLGVFSGLVAGIALLIYLVLTGHDPFRGWNAGFLALALNFVVTVIVSLLTNNRRAGSEESLPPAVS